MTTFDDVRRIALALPEAEERLTWDVDITFRVRDKIFAMGGAYGGSQLAHLAGGSALLVLFGVIMVVTALAVLSARTRWR